MRMWTASFSEVVTVADLLLAGWNSVNAINAIVTTPVHTPGGHAIAFEGGATSGSWLTRSFIAGKTSGNLYWRTYIRFPSFDTTNSFRTLSRFTDAGSGMVNIQFNPSTKLFRIATAIGTITNATMTTAINANQWYRLEARVLIFSTAVGVIEMNLYDGDALTELENVIATGVQTINVGGSISGFEFGNRSGLIVTSGGVPFYMDDFALNDDVGSTPDISWPGPGYVETLVPDGSVTQLWSRTGGGSANYQAIDDMSGGGSPDDATTYLSTTNITDIERVSLSDLSAAADGKNFRSYQVFYRTFGVTVTSTILSRVFDGGSTDDQASIACVLSTWRVTATDVIHYWGITGEDRGTVNAIEVGFKGNSGAGNEKRVTAVWVNVEYRDPIDIPKTFADDINA